MGKRLTDQAEWALEAAIQEARAKGKNRVGWDDALVGLILEGKGLAAVYLNVGNIILPRVREFARLVRIVEPESGSGSMAEGAGRIFGAAEVVADSLGHDYVGVEHILLAMVDRPTCLGAQIIRGLGGSLEQLKNGVRQKLGCWPEGKPEDNIPRADDGTPLTVTEAQVTRLVDGFKRRIEEHGCGPEEIDLWIDVMIGRDGPVWAACKESKRLEELSFKARGGDKTARADLVAAAMVLTRE